MQEILRKYDRQLKCESDVRDKLAIEGFRDELTRQSSAPVPPSAPK
jgi:hypothetical protein